MSISKLFSTGKKPTQPKPVSNCFGCSPSNAIGLQLEFTEENDSFYALVSLGRNYESYPGVIHGGIVATVLDEAMGRAVLGGTGGLGLTLGLRVRFSRPVEPHKNYRVSSRVVSRDGPLLKVEARLTDVADKIIAAGEATFSVVSDKADLGNLPPATMCYIRSESKEGHESP